MSTKLLVNLLGVQESIFRNYIEKLEHASLVPGVDIRLSAEIITKTRDKARSLGFTEPSATAEEVYHSLKIKLESDDRKMQEHLGFIGASSGQIASKLAKTTQNLSSREQSISLTAAGTKRVLTAVPPRKTMRALKFRSLSSVLKRVDPRLLYSVACLIEDKSWRSQVHAKMRRLDSRDIGWQPVNCVAVPSSWYEKLGDVLSSKGLYIVNAETGVVCVMPVLSVVSNNAVQSTRAGSAILSMGMLLHAAQTVSAESLPYRNRAYQDGFSTILPELAHGIMPELVSIHGMKPTWRVVHEMQCRDLLSTGSSELEFAIDELNWQTAEMKLASLVPDMDFWVDTHYLAMKNDLKPVSLHFMDVADAVVKEADFSDHSNTHMQGSLWNELHIRYLQEDSLTHSLNHQLTKHSMNVNI